MILRDSDPCPPPDLIHLLNVIPRQNNRSTKVHVPYCLLYKCVGIPTAGHSCVYIEYSTAVHTRCPGADCRWELVQKEDPPSELTEKSGKLKTALTTSSRYMIPTIFVR
jgi:hypothetical protein